LPLEMAIDVRLMQGVRFSRCPWELRAADVRPAPEVFEDSLRKVPTVSD